MKTINKNIKTLSTKLKAIKNNSRSIRDEFLKELIQKAKLDDNLKYVKYLSNLIIIEHQQNLRRSIKHHTYNHNSSGINFIEIPIDRTIPWNSIPPSLPKDQWKKIDNPEVIEKVLTSYNTAHLSQSEGKPFTIVPLKDLLGTGYFALFGDVLLHGTTNIDSLPLSNLQRLYLNKLKKTSGYLSSPLLHQISIEDMTSGLKKWKERTITVSSHRHLRHYISFIVSDSNDNKPEHVAFVRNSLQTIKTILNDTIASGVPLRRWPISIPHTNKLRVIYIYIYEVDYNLLLKYF